jgi:hypothetical protein
MIGSLKLGDNIRHSRNLVHGAASIRLISVAAGAGRHWPGKASPLIRIPMTAKRPEAAHA